jgi:hypothetical protein
LSGGEAAGEFKEELVFVCPALAEGSQGGEISGDKPGGRQETELGPFPPVPLRVKYVEETVEKRSVAERRLRLETGNREGGRLGEKLAVGPLVVGDQGDGL